MKKILLAFLFLIPTTITAASEPATCAVNSTAIIGETDDGVYIGWWCSETSSRIYGATWKWLTYSNKEKLIPLVKKEATEAAVEIFISKHATTPVTDPVLSKILIEGRIKLNTTRPIHKE